MLWPFSNIVEKSWIADAGLRAGVAGASASRRPWQIEETDACFILRDANGRALAYCDAAACSPATRHGGIAANIARIRHVGGAHALDSRKPTGRTRPGIMVPAALLARATR